MEQETANRVPAFRIGNRSFDGPVAVVNERGQIVSCTPAMGSVLGYEVPELVGKTVGEVAADGGRGILGTARPVAAATVSFVRRDGKNVQMFCRRSPYVRGTDETFAFLDCLPPAAPSAVLPDERSPGEKALMTARIRHALRDGDIIVHYQPVVELSRGTVCGFEALARWRSRAHGLIEPGGFLPFAEESGLVSVIEEQVLRAACARGKAWAAPGATPLQLGVNVSAGHLAQPGFARLVDDVLRQTGFPARHLELEVAEKALEGQHAGVLRSLASLREIGVGLTVDDFGAGVPAFDRLRLLPLNRVKVHGAVVREMAAGPAGARIMAALVAVGHCLGADVAAKCVETAAQARILRELGCFQAQGFLFGRPSPDAAAASTTAAAPQPSFSSADPPALPG